MDKRIIEKLVQFGLITNIDVNAEAYDSVDELINKGIITIPGAKTKIDEIIKEFEIETLENIDNAKVVNGEEKVTKCEEKVTKREEKVTKCEEKVTKCEEKVTKDEEKVTKDDEKVVKDDETVVEIEVESKTTTK